MTPKENQEFRSVLAGPPPLDRPHETSWSLHAQRQRHASLVSAIIMGGRITELSVILEQPWALEFKDPMSGHNMLHIAAKAGATAAMEKLLTFGFNPNEPDRVGNAPLHLATKQLFRRPVEILLDAGADVHGVGYKGHTPLHNAAQSGGVDLVYVLVERGAKVDARSAHEQTPLHLAASKGHNGAVCALIDAGAELNVVDKDRRTPLFLAAYSDHLRTAMGLIASGASPAGAYSRAGKKSTHKCLRDSAFKNAVLLCSTAALGRHLKALPDPPQSDLAWAKRYWKSKDAEDLIGLLAAQLARRKIQRAMEMGSLTATTSKLQSGGPR